MAQKRLPLVSDNLLLLLDRGADEYTPVVVGSQRWYTWLADEQNRSFSFRNHLGTFTARRERKRHGWYWYVYRKCGGKLRKAYLGKAEEVTLERLAAVAATLVDRRDSGDALDERVRVSSEHALQGHAAPASGGKQLLLVPTFASQAEPGLVSKHNLPAQLTPLIGREQEVASASALLRRTEVRLLVLTGTGGIGKTRLGLQIATDLLEDFPAGVCFVSLAPLRDPALVAPTVAHTLGLREAARGSVVDHLKGYLREKQLLLLLDNFEQVVTAAPLLTEFLAACPKLKILVSSRALLHVHGEHEFAVPPLALPDPKHLPESEALSQYASVALFLQRARALKPEFYLTSTNARAIAEICVRLEGLPLAIEMAAARIKQLPPQALLARLEHRLQVLTSGPQDVPVRQQTLRNTLAWSYNLLDLQEQRLFRRLSIFVGGCTLEAAEAVCAALGNGDGHGVAAVFDGVTSLIDKSLLLQTEQEGEEPRFVMLETTREYGLEALTLSEELEATRRAHADYYLALAERAMSAWEGSQQAVWLGRLERDHDNLRAVMQWSLERGEGRPRMEVAFRLGGALRSFWQVRGFFSEGRTFLERVLAQSEGCLPSLRAKALNDAVHLAVSQGDPDGGEALCQESLARCRELGDGSAIARALYLLGWIAWMKGSLVTAHSLLDEALALFREVGDKGGILITLFWVGVVVIQQGEYARGRVLFEQILAMQRELGNKRGIAWSLFQLGWVFFLSQSDLTMIHPLLTEAGALFREIGEKWGIAECSWLLGRLALQQGDAVMAHTLLEQSLTLFSEIGNRRGIAHSLSQLGDVAAVQRDWAAARVLYEESLTLATEMGDKLVTVSCLEGLAGVAATERARPVNAPWAAQLWGAAEALRDTMGAPIPPVERATYERRVAAARSSIGMQRFSAYWVQGRTMTPEQALAAQGNAAMSYQPSTEPASTLPRKVSANPAGLTEREVEVLRWVACGLTDAQVAEQLIISPRTVTSHLSSIYNKLGVTSRSAATRFAIEHQLL